MMVAVKIQHATHVQVEMFDRSDLPCGSLRFRSDADAEEVLAPLRNWRSPTGFHEWKVEQARCATLRWLGNTTPLDKVLTLARTEGEDHTTDLCPCVEDLPVSGRGLL